MPVRKIPKNHLVVTGRFCSHKVGAMLAFESLLEKEQMILLEFDPRVRTFEPQPVHVPVDGSPGYTPDLLVHYVDGVDGHPLQPTELIEVKASWDFEKHAEKYAPKFEAAANYAAERGWVFLKRNDQDIRTPRLANLKFLLRYRGHAPDPAHHDRLIELLDAAGGESASDALLDRLSGSDDERAAWIASFWILVSLGHIQTDIDVPFKPGMAIWLPEDM